MFYTTNAAIPAAFGFAGEPLPGGNLPFDFLELIQHRLFGFAIDAFAFSQIIEFRHPPAIRSFANGAVAFCTPFHSKNSTFI